MATASATRCWSSAVRASMPSASSAAKRWLVCLLGSLRLRPPRPGPLRMLRRSRAPAGPGGGPHHPQKPGRLRRHQQPAGALLPLQRRQARRLFAYARGRTDFRGVQASYALREAGCVFCALEGSGWAGLLNARGGMRAASGWGAGGDPVETGLRKTATLNWATKTQLLA
jgi:hypothetical protein